LIEALGIHSASEYIYIYILELRKPGLELGCRDGGELGLCKVPQIQGVAEKIFRG
jgi:hypothetical protein